MEDEELKNLCKNIIQELNLEEKANLDLLNSYKSKLAKKISELTIKQFKDNMPLFVKTKSYYRNIFQALTLFLTIIKLDTSTQEGQMTYDAYLTQYKYYKEKFEDSSLF
jgi:hypothetical protein